MTFDDKLNDHAFFATGRHYALFERTRRPNLNPGFRARPHFCPGGPLAKMEIRLALEELIQRCDGSEITGPVERVQSTRVGGLKHLPVKLISHVAAVG